MSDNNNTVADESLASADVVAIETASSMVEDKQYGSSEEKKDDDDTAPPHQDIKEELPENDPKYSDPSPVLDSSLGTGGEETLVEQESVRAGTISVTFKRNSNIPLGLEFQEVVVVDNMKTKEHVVEEGSPQAASSARDNASSKQEALRATQKKIVFSSIAKESILPLNCPIQVGDELVAVNGKTPTSTRDFVMMQLYHENNYSTNHQNLVTLTVRTPTGNPSLVQAFVAKPTPDTPVGIQVASKVVHPTTKRTTALQVVKVTGKREPSSAIMGDLSKHWTGFGSGPTSGTTAADAPTGLLHDSVLQKGDILLSVNTTILQSLADLQGHPSAAEEGQGAPTVNGPNINHQPPETPLRQWRPTQVVELIQQSPEYVSLVALRPTPWHQKWTHGLRQTAIGVGGGTLAMGETIIGGSVNLLGTELEASKQALKSARDSLQKPWETVGSTWSSAMKMGGGNGGDTASAEPTNDDQTGQEQSATIQGRFSTLGLGVSIPFLGQRGGAVETPQCRDNDTTGKKEELKE